MLALQALGSSCLAPLSVLVASAQQLQMAASYLERIADVMRAEPEQGSRQGLLSPRLTGAVRVDSVSFKYAGDAPLVLQDVSFTVQPGQKVALVGPTGSGKSTLAMLLLGLYTPTQGRVLYDGIVLSDLDLRSLRSQLGAVLQESLLFSGSIRQNITLGNPDLTLDQVEECGELAALHSEINRMPMGYDTLVSEAGSTLSGGQRQRIALARALATRPPVLILDEATSHLDVRTEAEIDRNLSRLDCTRITVAHRLSTVRNADRILVLNRGRLVEEGTHDELMGRKGEYAMLVQNQMTGGIPSHTLAARNEPELKSIETLWRGAKGINLP